MVIPHFNRADLLAQTLDSIRRQTFDDWEVIVVDDGSTADQLQRIQGMQDDRIRVLQRGEEPKGPSKSRNIGLQDARGDYVMFVDSDDLLAPWCLKSRIQQAEQQPGKSMWVFPVMLFHQTMGDVQTLWNDMTGPGDLERFLRSDPPWHTSSPLWKRTELQKLGGFNNELMYGDDSDLHIRALLREMPCVKFPEVLPDSFVRRDNSPRITNSCSESLLNSRRIRLTEGSMALRTASAKHRLAWEGQYFSEAEFLLFNAAPAAAHIHSLLSVWKKHHAPGLLRWMLVRLYLAIALFTKKRAYIVLRLARRAAMLCLPADYFPVAPHFQCMPVSSEVYRRLCERIPEMKPTNGEIDARVSA